MNYRNHMITTALLAIAILYYLKVELSAESVIWLILAVIASLLPDIDLEHSKANQFLNPIFLVVSVAIAVYFLEMTVVALFAGIILFLLLKFVMLPMITGSHRTNTHTIYFPAFIALPIYLHFGFFFASAVAFGILAHLLEDVFTDMTRLGG